MAADCSGHEAGLFHGADIIGLARATSLSGTNVVAVTSAVGGFHPGECSAIAHIVELHAVADQCAVFLRIDQNSTHGASRDIHHIVDGPAAVRESSQVSYQKAETLLATHCSWRNAGV